MMKPSLNYYQEALKINRKIGYKEGVATNPGNIGLVYITLGQSEEALKYYQSYVAKISGYTFFISYLSIYL